MNKEVLKAGRPFKFPTVRALKARIKDYFDYVKSHDVPLTIERLCCFLDCSRNTLLNYQARDEFAPIITRVKREILANKAEMLLSNKGNTQGIIFDLKNNHGYRDKQDVEMSRPATFAEFVFQAHTMQLKKDELEDRCYSEPLKGEADN